MQTHSNTRISETHGDTATHGARTNNRGFVDLNQRCVFIKTRNLIRGTFCKEDMNQCFTLWIFHAFAKQALLFFHARIKRFGIHSRFNTFKNLLWCKLTTVCLLDLLRRIFKYFCITAIGCNLVFQITYFACLAARGNNLFSKGNARFNDIAIGNTVNNA